MTGILSRLNAQHSLQESFLHNREFIHELALILEIEIDGGDSAEAYILDCMKEAWKKVKIRSAENLHKRVIEKINKRY